MTNLRLALGLHEELLTTGLQAALDGPHGLELEIHKVDPADQPHVLARHLYELARRTFEGQCPDQEARVRLFNKLVGLVETPGEVTPPSFPGSSAASTLSSRWPRVLGDECRPPHNPTFRCSPAHQQSRRAQPGRELRAELESCDEVDLLCAFVKWHGLRLLEPELGRRADGAPLAGHHDDLHGRHRTRRSRRLVASSAPR